MAAGDVSLPRRPAFEAASEGSQFDTANRGPGVNNRVIKMAARERSCIAVGTTATGDYCSFWWASSTSSKESLI